MKWPTFSACLVSTVMTCLAPPAAGHDWFTGLTDPESGYGCCGGQDCRVVPADWITEVPGGYRVTLTAAQAMTINPAYQWPVNAFVPYARVQPTYDGEGRPALCLLPMDRHGPRHGVRCLMAGGTS